jgi:hypothetical protein
VCYALVNSQTGSIQNAQKSGGFQLLIIELREVSGGQTTEIKAGIGNLGMECPIVDCVKLEKTIERQTGCSIERQVESWDTKCWY